MCQHPDLTFVLWEKKGLVLFLAETVFIFSSECRIMFQGNLIGVITEDHMFLAVCANC